MAQYINKATLIAELESKRKYAQNLGDNAINGSMQQFYDGMKQGCVDLLSFLTILEVKEVDLEKEIDQWQGCEVFPEGIEITPLPKAMKIVERTAKHFFELGLKVQKGE